MSEIHDKGQMIVLPESPLEIVTRVNAYEKQSALLRELVDALDFALNYGDFEESCTDNKLASGCLDKAQSLLRRAQAAMKGTK